MEDRHQTILVIHINSTISFKQIFNKTFIFWHTYPHKVFLFQQPIQMQDSSIQKWKTCSQEMTSAEDSPPVSFHLHMSAKALDLSFGTAGWHHLGPMTKHFQLVKIMSASKTKTAVQQILSYSKFLVMKYCKF